MTSLVSEAAARAIFWGAMFGGSAIAGGAVFMAFTGGQPLMGLPSLAVISLLIGLPTTMLICLAFRIMRGAYSAPPDSIFARRAAIAAGVIHVAFLVAVLILLAAWLTALALGATIGPPLLQALILTVVLFVLARMSCLSLVNRAIAIQGPGEDSAAS